jgi:hypothetical protein
VTVYRIGDAVAYGGSSYVSIVTGNTDRLPTATGYWALLAAQGASGPSGPTGAPGSAGAQGATGATGSTGTQGIAGAIGLTGATGAIGPTGPTGSQGTQGTQGPGLTWVEVAGTTQQAAVNTGYLAGNAAEVTITLPAEPKIGATVRVSGTGIGVGRSQNANQMITETCRFRRAGLGHPRDEQEDWYSIASSADGAKLVAAAPGEQIYTSTNSGGVDPRETNRVGSPRVLCGRREVGGGGEFRPDLHVERCRGELDRPRDEQVLVFRGFIG